MFSLWETRTRGFFLVFPRHLNFTSSINLSSRPPFFLCPPASLPHASPPAPYQTPLRQHNSLFSLTTTVAIECCQPDSPSPLRQALPPPGCPASAANPLSKGQEGPSLAQCLMGSDSSVFWDYARWKGGHSSTDGLCHSTATVCFWQDSCSKPSRPPWLAWRERTQRWLPFIGGVGGCGAAPLPEFHSPARYSAAKVPPSSIITLRRLEWIHGNESLLWRKKIKLWETHLRRFCSYKSNTSKFVIDYKKLFSFPWKLKHAQTQESLI